MTGQLQRAMSRLLFMSVTGLALVEPVDLPAIIARAMCVSIAAFVIAAFVVDWVAASDRPATSSEAA